VPLVRTRSAHPTDVGRPLDLGAQGVLVPNVGGADHVREVVASTRYAPAGRRSIGRLSGGADEPLVLVMVETAAALEDLDAVLAVDGLDGVYVGPGDLGLALGLSAPADRPRLGEVIASVVSRAHAAGVPVGVHTYGGADAAAWAAEGTTLVTATVDVTVLTEGVRGHLATARGGAGERTGTGHVIADVIARWHSWLAGELPGGLEELLADDVVFHSPVVFTPQRGRAVTTRYLEAAAAVLPGDPGAGGFRYTREVLAGDTAVLEFETTLDGRYVDGVDIIRCDRDGRIVEFRVMVRPLQAIQAVAERMRERLTG
jgi:4-hydroxy-2-oxoheptanedioate aldolase